MECSLFVLKRHLNFDSEYVHKSSSQSGQALNKHISLIMIQKMRSGPHAPPISPERCNPGAKIGVYLIHTSCALYWAQELLSLKTWPQEELLLFLYNGLVVKALIQEWKTWLNRLLSQRRIKSMSPTTKESAITTKLLNSLDMVGGRE